MLVRRLAVARLVLPELRLVRSCQNNFQTRLVSTSGATTFVYVYMYIYIYMHIYIYM